MDYKKVPVDDYSSPIIEAATEEMVVSDIGAFFKNKGYRHMPVIRDGRPVGMISDRDVALLACFSGKEQLTAKEIMVSDPYCVEVGTSLHEVCLEMSNSKIGSALIVDENGKLDSIFTSIDGLNALVEVLRGDI
ncbi:MAG: CBS domain-containing protein [Bdellovibrionaceae bacterium]|jgi:acetoin utilization protein AcuB|nr:CBS domain-containing protein [Pseudobdellovibrionaceae bacterium]